MNTMFAIATTLALGVVSGAGVASEGNFFIHGDIGQARYRVGSLKDTRAGFNEISKDDGLDRRTTAGALRFGYRWHSLVDYGIEAGYADLGKATSSSGDGIRQIKSRGWLLGGNLKYNIDDDWYVSGRVGWIRSKIQNRGNATVYPICTVCVGLVRFDPYNDSSTGTGEYVGVGAGYNVSPNLSFGLSYDDYHVRPSHASSNFGMKDGAHIGLFAVSAEYRF